MDVHVQITTARGTETKRFRIGLGYGRTPETALETLTLALVHVERSAILDVNGRLTEFPPGSVRQIMVTEGRSRP